MKAVLILEAIASGTFQPTAAADDLTRLLPWDYQVLTAHMIMTRASAEQPL